MQNSYHRFRIQFLPSTYGYLNKFKWPFTHGLRIQALVVPFYSEAIRCLSLRRWIYLDPLDVGSIFLYGLPTVVKNGNYTFSGFDLNHWRFGRKWVGRFLVKMSSRRDFGRFESIIFGRRFSLAKKLNTF